MSNFHCKHCGTAIVDTPNGYITGCEHYPIEQVKRIPSCNNPKGHFWSANSTGTQRCLWCSAIRPVLEKPNMTPPSC